MGHPHFRRADVLVWDTHKFSARQAEALSREYQMLVYAIK